MAVAEASAAERLGVPPESFISFREPPCARHLRYMDLLGPARQSENSSEAGLEGVIEVSGKAALYVVQSALLSPAAPGGAEISQLMRSLACRADAEHLAVVSPGVMTIYRIGFYSEGGNIPVDAVIEADDPIGVRKFLNEPRGNTRQTRAERLWLDDLLFDLLTRAADGLRESFSSSIVSDSDVLSLIGRALFTRFLVDRGIVKAEEVLSIAAGVKRPEDLFGSVGAMAATFEWLDRTFNGDLLELGTKDYRGYIKRLGPEASHVCTTLSNIMARSSDGQLSLDWEGLRFEHIPVDVFSQVYEHFAHRFMPDRAHKTSIHYTPRYIAELIVDGVFAATPASKRHLARVLDPAAGAGVFLVLAFRRLVAERWLYTGKRPQRAAIRKILTEQLCGLDVNPTSVKVAALSLYLAALELDPQPQPLSDLRFERLFDTALKCVDAQRLHGAPDAALGSLSTRMKDFGPFDIVLANPPWTALAAGFRKDLEATAPAPPPGTSPQILVPHQWPDLAFMWRSTGWCRPGGVIGLVLHARLLFSEETAQARALWFSKTRVTGVLNGMFLRKDKRIWPSNTQPFCAVVSINSPPDALDSFYFLSPRLEPALAQKGEFRLDPRSATPVPQSLAARERYSFKVLARGSALDLDLVARLHREPRMALGDYLDDLGLHLHQGFISGHNDLQDATPLRGLRVLMADDKPRFAVNVEALPKIEQRFPALAFQWPRDREIYRGPHVLFRQSPKHLLDQRGALYTNGDVAFSRSFYGVSIPHGLDQVGDYLYLLSYSDLFLYCTLMTSSQFGVERDTFNMVDIANMPVTPVAALRTVDVAEVSRLAACIRAGEAPWGAVNALTARLYGLSTYDQQLISDAVAFEAPYTQVLASALARVEADSTVVCDFAGVLASMLSDLTGVAVHAVPQRVGDNDGSWQFVHIGTTATRKLDVTRVRQLLHQVGDPLQTSEIRLQLGPNDWLIGRVRQARYWTSSQARLLALDLSELGMFAEATSN